MLKIRLFSALSRRGGVEMCMWEWSRTWSSERGEVGKQREWEEEEREKMEKGEFREIAT